MASSVSKYSKSAAFLGPTQLQQSFQIFYQKELTLSQKNTKIYKNARKLAIYHAKLGWL